MSSLPTRRRFVAEIQWTREHPEVWTRTQNADWNGRAVCSGCQHRRCIVYSNFLQWCEGCWPVIADLSPDTQPKDWQQRRAGQERDYEWKQAA